MCRSADRSQNLRRWNSYKAASLLLMASPILAHDVITTKLSWTQEMSRLVNRHCLGCHREGGAAFSLATYSDARPWAKAIRDEVLGRRMPPWGPVKGVGAFHGDPSLSLPEIDMFVAWVEGGAPEGDPALLPSHAVAPPTVAAPVQARHRLEVQSGMTLEAPAVIVALRPNNLKDRESLEAWATKPDGTIERLIWLRDYRTAWTRDYRLRTPLRFPRGTRIHVSSAGGASLLLLAQ